MDSDAENSEWRCKTEDMHLPCRNLTSIGVTSKGSVLTSRHCRPGLCPKGDVVWQNVRSGYE